MEKVTRTAGSHAQISEGRLATATRRDLAEAAAVVLTSPGHEDTVYELSGDTAQILDTPVCYEVLTSGTGTRHAS